MAEAMEKDVLQMLLNIIMISRKRTMFKSQAKIEIRLLGTDS